MNEFLDDGCVVSSNTDFLDECIRNASVRIGFVSHSICDVFSHPVLHMLSFYMMRWKVGFQVSHYCEFVWEAISLVLIASKTILLLLSIPYFISDAFFPRLNCPDYLWPVSFRHANYGLIYELHFSPIRKK